MNVRLRDTPGDPILGVNMHCLNGHERLDFVLANAKGRVLDVASGQGAFALALYQRGYEVEMLDILPTEPLPGIPFRQMNIYQLEDEALWDTILFQEIVEHLTEPEQALDICKKALKPGGRLLLTTPWVDTWDHATDHVWRFGPVGIAELLATWRAQIWTDDIFVYAVAEVPTA